MRTHAQLCHVSSDHYVVLVEAFEGTTSLGSALGDGGTATEAEDQALNRLRLRLGQVQPQAAPQSPAEIKEDAAVEASVPLPVKADSVVDAGAEGTRQPKPIRHEPQPIKTATPASEAPQQPTDPGDDVSAAQGGEEPLPQPPSESPTDPEDWSEELTAIDLELQRIGWDRDSEKIYLERAFGHASRHRLTRFSDLVAYLKRLRELAAESDPQLAAIPLRRSDLVMQGDEILQRLQWNQQQARDFLNRHLQANSRQQLTDEQLLNFNIMLEEQLLQS